MTFIDITCISDRSEEVIIETFPVGMTHPFLRHDRVDCVINVVLLLVVTSCPQVMEVSVSELDMQNTDNVTLKLLLEPLLL